MLLVDELVSHAFISTGPSRVVLEVSQDSVRVALEDTDVTERQPSAAPQTDVLDDLADDWGYDVGAVGTAVWFTLGRPGR
jgi:hypothetical protein